MLGKLFEAELKFKHNLQKFLVSVKLRAEFKPPRADKTLLTLRLAEARVSRSQVRWTRVKCPFSGTFCLVRTFDSGSLCQPVQLLFSRHYRLKQQSLHVTATKWLLGSTHFISIRNPPQKHSFLVYGVGCAHSTWRALEFTWKLRSKMTHIISLSVLLVCSFCLLPHKRIFFLSGGTNRAFPAILPFSHFINSGHNAFDVIFGSAPGLRAHWPARHSRHSIIFLSSPAVHTHTRAHTLAYSERWAGSAPAPNTQRASPTKLDSKSFVLLACCAIINERF